MADELYQVFSWGVMQNTHPGIHVSGSGVLSLAPGMRFISQTTPNYVQGGVSNIFTFVFAFVCLSIDAKTAKNKGRLW